MAAKIGVIAEDHSDIEVLYALTCKLTAENNFSFSKFVGRGCGKLRKKCHVWAENLIQRGCSCLVVVHDLDTNNESQLRAKLENSVKTVGFRGYLILIPIREIEAWLLVDARALRRSFQMKSEPRLPKRPENIHSPKEYLRKTVWQMTKKHYINTIHNKRIAEMIRTTQLNACQSFRPYPIFIASII